jgi:hypothetical protein
MVDDILRWGAAGANAVTGHSANKASKEMMRRQAQTIQLQNQNFLAAQPYFKQALERAAMYAGLGDGVSQGANGNFQLGAQPGQNFGMGGNWGNREDQLRLQAAEEDINRQAKMRGDQMRFQFGRAGLNQGALGANLARNQAGALQQYGQFRRGLAIDAGQEQERRMQALQNLIAQGFGQGSQAAAGFGQQAGQYGQQAAGAFQGIGNILQQQQYMQALRGMPQPGATASAGLPVATSQPMWARDPRQQPNWWDNIG